MFKQQEKIILASNSYGRKYVLNYAEINYSVAENLIDDEQEDTFKQTVEHLSIEDQIQQISDYKGLNISKQYPEHYVLSGDQASVVEGEIISKPKTRAEAIAHLTAHAGKTYLLVTSATLCKNGEVIWKHQETPTVKLTKFSMKDAENYVSIEEKSPTGGVIGIAGACKIESPAAIHLIKEVSGNHHTIIGLPINAVTHQLYKLKVII